MTTKTIDGIDYEVVDLADAPPVELDPPDPTVARWQELVAKPSKVEHDGDASEVMPQPRPAWSDPDLDHVGASWRQTYYSSETAIVYASHSTGWFNDEIWRPATVSVTAKLYANGETSISVANKSFTGPDGFGHWALGLTVAETLELIDVLRAAVDLIGGP